MQRQHTLLVTLLLLIGAGVALTVLFTGPDAPPPDLGPGPSTTAPDDGATRRGDLGGRQADAGDRTAVRTAADDTGDGRRRDLHPSVRAALAGFEGRVVTSDGSPVADSLVRLYRFALDQAVLPKTQLFLDDDPEFPDAFVAEQRTGEDGRFRLTGVFPRAFFLLRADVDGDAPTNRIIQRTPGPKEMVDLGDIVLLDCGVLTGRVVDDLGEPVADAWVHAIDLPGQLLAFYPVQRFDTQGGLLIRESGIERVFEIPSWVEQRFAELPVPTARTDADGHFRIGGVVPGGNLFTIYKPGLLDHTRDRIDVAAGEEKDLGEIRLDEGQVAGGRVLDEQGEPIEGAEIMVAEASPNDNVPVHLAHRAPDSAADGSFEVAGFPPGEVYGAARRRKSDPWTIAGPVDVLDDLELVLPSEHSLTLRIVDPADEPIDDARIQVQVGDVNEGALQMAMFGMTQPVEVEERLRRLEDGSYVVGGLASGDYCVLVDAPGRAVTANDVNLDQDTTLTVVLEGEIGFDAYAFDQTGAPVAGAEVYAMARGPRPRLPDGPIWVGVTDDEGLVRVDGVRGEEVALSAQHPAYGTAHARSPMPPAAPVRLTFLTPGSISGNLLEGGAEPEFGKWMVFCMRSWSGDDTRGAFPDMPRLVTPGLDGSFQIQGLKPGSYRLQVTRSVDVLTSPGKSMQFATSMMMMGDTDSTSVEVAAGGTAQVTLDAMAGKMVTGPSANVSGTLLIDGQAGSGYLVSAYGGGKRKTEETDASGRFDFGLMPAGDVRLRVMPKPSGDFLSMRRMGDELWDERFKLEEGVDKVLFVELQMTRLAGTVLSASGGPAKNVRIRARGQVTRPGNDEEVRQVSFSEETDSSGRFEFEDVPAGRYTLTVSDDELGSGRLEGLDAAPGLGATGLQLMLAPVFAVRGRVDMTFFGEEKPRWFGIQLIRSDAENGTRKWARVDEDTGNFEASGLAPGSYRIEAFGANVDDVVGAAPIQLGNADLDGVVVRLVRQAPADERRGK